MLVEVDRFRIDVPKQPLDSRGEAAHDGTIRRSPIVDDSRQQPCFEAWNGEPFAHGIELRIQLPVTTDDGV